MVNGVEPGFKAVAFIAAAMYVESPGLRVVAKVYPFLQGVGRCVGLAGRIVSVGVARGRGLHVSETIFFWSAFSNVLTQVICEQPISRIYDTQPSNNCLGARLMGIRASNSNSNSN